jgi:F0F1-type ATP synthase assembly protein I
MANNKFSKLNFLSVLSLGMGLGLLVATPLVLFLLLGIFLDKKFGTLPLFLIVFILLSLVVVAYEIRSFILPFLEKRSQKIKNNN